ncbi:MAG: two pore domain potassium channel family protein [Cyclobacteriaceae bacterium]|nr:two pore domain potassium channel family protein [Cyclobacteriaceae bacterium]
MPAFFVLIEMVSIKNFWAKDSGFIWLLALTVASIILNQFSIGNVWAEFFIIRLTFFLFTFIAIASSALSPTTKKIGYTVAILLLIFALGMIESTNRNLIIIHGTLVSTYMIFILAMVVSQIFEGEKMTVSKIAGGVAVYILIGHIWASLYLTNYLLNPSAILEGGEPIEMDQSLRKLSYFSFVTLTTIGYGDITAAAPFTRVLVILEGLLGQLFPAIFIAKLVSLQIEHSKKR